MTSKLVVNTIEADTGISSVSFASSISLSSTSVFHLGDAGFNIGADTNINRAGNGVIGFNINGSEKTRINSNGFIGINTSSPLAPLHTYNDTSNTIARLESGDATCRLQLKDSAGEGYVIASGDNLILANTSSITERLRIDSTGRVLVGTTIQGTAGADDLTLSTGGSTGITIRSGSSNDGNLYFAVGTTGNETYRGFIQYEHSNNAFRFGTNATERLRIDAGGNMNVTGVGTFSGGVRVGYDTTYSPIQQAATTWWYTRADQATSVSGSNIVNLATSSIKSSETIPISNMTRQSDAGAHSFYNSSATSGSVSRDMSSADPFHPKAHGLTMGTMFRAHTSGNNGSGVIHYGATSTSQHFFVRYKYSSNSILVGADTNGSDTWTTAYQNDLMSDNNWYFFVVAIERNGTLLTSLNGAPLTPIRMSGTAPAPGNARFGLAGDPYTDNDSRHRYATAFWHKGVISNDLIAQEYAWLKTIWTGASLP